MTYSNTAGLPVAGEISTDMASVLAEGQPILLTLNGRPAAVVVDYESWAEVEEAMLS